MIFSQKDCEYISSFGNTDCYLDGLERGKVHYNNQTLSLKREVKGRYIDICSKDLIHFLTLKLNCIGIKSISLGELKLTLYRRGDYFAPHRDYIHYDQGTVVKTAVIQLSSPLEYEGGDLLVKGIPQSKKLGSVIMFNSRDLHEVTKVRSGVRKSLVVFLLAKDLFLPKSIL